jgi:hypothetical protein
MADELLKPNRKYDHIYAILRYETDVDADAPIDLRVTVKKVVVDPRYAESEVNRLNALNKDKNAYYFCQVTRFEEMPVETQALQPMQCSASEDPRP